MKPRTLAFSINSTVYLCIYYRDVFPTLFTPIFSHDTETLSHRVRLVMPNLVVFILCVIVGHARQVLRRVEVDEPALDDMQ
jgi:uncharacterized membrane protein (DUF106 family)